MESECIDIQLIWNLRDIHTCNQFTGHIDASFDKEPLVLIYSFQSILFIIMSGMSRQNTLQFILCV